MLLGTLVARRGATAFMRTMRPLSTAFVPSSTTTAALGLRRVPSRAFGSKRPACPTTALGSTPATAAYPEVTYAESDLPLGQGVPAVGNYTRIMSQTELHRDFQTLGTLSAADAGKVVWVRGRVANIRAKGNSCFIVLRQGPFDTMQACYFKDKADPENSKALLKFMGSITSESVVDIQGTLAPAQVKSCSVNDVELAIHKVYVVSAAEPILPFQLEDAGRPEAEVEASQTTERPFPRIGQELRLDNRWMDLRVPANNCIMRIQSGVCQLFRESLYDQGFVEIHTPKLIGGESEGGAGVFRTDYFGRPACLAQSPQLYKQMAVSADLDRVFEIGPVFRAENSNTRRHLCEFTGLDIEMSIQEHYNEVLAVSHRMFKHIFEGLETRFAKELAIIREQYASEPVAFTDAPCVVHWPEAMQMLRGEGGMPEVGDYDDLSGAQELKLGELVKAKYGADFFILDKYPSAVRPFYTMPCPEDAAYSNSYDMFLRGQEICSGAQRIHDRELLASTIQAKGIPVEPLEFYLNSFRHGVSPHGGAGIGLERVVFLYLGLDNVRKASMFPRDPNRCDP